tara:strand:+ start:104 stop:460 length:357 start_codon:yes stop_codon:yes gene_type:complete
MTQNPAHPFVAQDPASSPTPNTHTNSTIVPENETPEELNLRLLNFANQLKQLPTEILQQLAVVHPQRNIPQIILVVAIKVGNIPLVEWVANNHLPVLTQTISPDTWSILNDIGFPIPS